VGAIHFTHPAFTDSIAVGGGYSRMGARKQAGVAVIGLGNWGTSLAAALEGVGLLAARVHASRSPRTLKNGPILAARILWLSVPDAAIASTVASLVQQHPGLRGHLVVHSSGALDRSVLIAAERAGARTASIHPMMSFPTGRVVSLAGVRFGVEAADQATRRELFSLIRRLRGRPFAVEGTAKAMYHAGAMFGSPLLVAALDAGVRCLQQSGIEEKEALALLCPMAAATVANLQRQGLRRSFSGPIARGDIATLKLHREALASHPLIAQVYDALAGLAARDLLPGGGPEIQAAVERALPKPPEAGKDDSGWKRSPKQRRR
jgi:predicted short-subunit dehydrogenase-like oxidoreductase (DUF2520 family)